MNERNQEAKRRIERALVKIEAAQILLGDACAELSPIIGGITAWRKCRKLYDQVHGLWRKIAYGIRHSKRVLMDTYGPYKPERNSYDGPCPVCAARGMMRRMPMKPRLLPALTSEELPAKPPAPPPPAAVREFLEKFDDVNAAATEEPTPS